MTDYDDPEASTTGEEHLTERELIGYGERRAAAAPPDSAGYKRTGAPSRWGSQDIEGQWPCRACGKGVDMTSVALEMFQGFNNHLRKLGEALIDSRQVAICDACHVELNRVRAVNARRLCDKTRWAVRVLRDGGTQEDEREAIKFLDREDPERVVGDSRKSAVVAYWMEKRSSSKGGAKKAEY